MKKAIASLLQVCLASLSLICTNNAIAQVTPDNTVGTQVDQNLNVTEITGGETRGENLFHSFQDFSVTMGSEAFFDNATDISNIFSRVTGGNVSNINGLIRANDANLFLINPAGILFGAGASLNLGGGSFYGTTADSILFEDGEFSAVDNLSEPILTINAPIGFNFRDNPADITVRSNGNNSPFDSQEAADRLVGSIPDGLLLDSGAIIGILGGDIIFEGGTLQASGGRIEIGSVGGGIVNLAEVAEGFAFQYSGVETFGNISLSAESNINARGDGGGDVRIVGRNISLNGGSRINTGTDSGSTGNSGNIIINANSLTLEGNSQISTATRGQGNAGNLIINASESIQLSGDGGNGQGRSGLFASALEEDGNGGNLQIFTQDLTIDDGGTINVGNFPSRENIANPSTGEAGNLTVEADSLTIENGGSIEAATNTGNGGNITLNIADNITLQNDSLISADASNNANGGNINIDTNFIVAFPNGDNDIIATAEQGNGGNITINAESLLGIQAGALNSFTNDINASSEFSLDGSITINSPDINTFQGETDLPQNMITPEQTTAEACRNRGVAQNSFEIKGKGGVPPAPDLPLSSHNISINGKQANSTVANPDAIATSQGEIIPARGINIIGQGKFVLTAHRTNNAGERLPAIKRNC